MEDILASIRRIIADDQSRHAPQLKRRFTLPAGLPADLATGDDRREAYPAADDGQPNGSMPDAAPTRTTDADAAGAPSRQADPSASTFPLDPDRPSADAFAAAVPHLNPPAPDGQPHDPALIEEIARIGAASILRPKPAASAAPPQPEPDAPLPPESQAPVEPASPVNGQVEEALVSEKVGSSVESSFLTLASSVFTQHEGAVERMLYDALRPLLKTWLDDNLPTIVERLVRSEIERVARGVRG